VEPVNPAGVTEEHQRTLARNHSDSIRITEIDGGRATPVHPDAADAGGSAFAHGVLGQGRRSHQQRALHFGCDVLEAPVATQALDLAGVGIDRDDIEIAIAKGAEQRARELPGVSGDADYGEAVMTQEFLYRLHIRPSTPILAPPFERPEARATGIPLKSLVVRYSLEIA
jgi:hypothetical protein